MIPGEPAAMPLTERQVTQPQPPSPLARKRSPLSSGHTDVICSPDHKPENCGNTGERSRRTMWASRVTQWQRTRLPGQGTRDLGQRIPWRRKQQSTPVSLPEKIPLAEERGGLQPHGVAKSRTQWSKRDGQDWRLTPLPHTMGGLVEAKDNRINKSDMKGIKSSATERHSVPRSQRPRFAPSSATERLHGAEKSSPTRWVSIRPASKELGAGGGGGGSASSS